MKRMHFSSQSVSQNTCFEKDRGLKQVCAGTYLEWGKKNLPQLPQICTHPIGSEIFLHTIFFTHGQV